MKASRKYFSRIGLLWVDLIHRSRRLHVPLPGAALIYIDPFRVIDLFQINLSCSAHSASSYVAFFNLRAPVQMIDQPVLLFSSV